MNGSRSLRAKDVVAVLVITFLLLCIVVPAIGHNPVLNRLEQCAMNLRGIAISSKIYANDNHEHWPIPPHSLFAVREGFGIDYLNHDRTTREPNTDPGEVGYERDSPTFSETPLNLENASTEVSATRAFWILVRSGDIFAEQFICPSTNDLPDPTFDIWDYYDFTGYHNVSYGYQVPFGDRLTRPREGADNRMVFIADKGPFYTDEFEPNFRGPRNAPLDIDGPTGMWRRYNSPNHHGTGQNVARADGSVSFEYRPHVGVHGDNIYTLMADEWDGTNFNLIHGYAPHDSPFVYPYPGQGALGLEDGVFSVTDSLIYP